jgi:hypothetical protein
VTTLNGGDQVIPVSVRVSGRPEPILTGAPSLLDFGVAHREGRKARTVKLTNAGTGTLIGSIAVKGSWLSVTESRFKGNEVAFEVIANTAGLTAGEHQAEVLIFSNGGQAVIQALVEVSAPPSEGLSARPAPAEAPAAEAPAGAGADGSGGAPGATAAGPSGGAPGDPGDGPAPLSPEAQRDLLRRIVRIEPETVWERDFLRRVLQLIRAGERMAPGELAKIYELEARARGDGPDDPPGTPADPP